MLTVPLTGFTLSQPAGSCKTAYLGENKGKSKFESQTFTTPIVTTIAFILLKSYFSSLLFACALGCRVKSLTHRKGNRHTPRHRHTQTGKKIKYIKNPKFSSPL